MGDGKPGTKDIEDADGVYVCKIYSTGVISYVQDTLVARWWERWRWRELRLEWLFSK